MSVVLFVGNLSRSTGAETLGHLFETVGNIVTAEIAIRGEPGISRGYGFVTMKDAATAAQAVQQLNGRTLDGNVIRVEFARQSRRNNSAPGFRQQAPRGSFRGGFRRPTRRGRGYPSQPYYPYNYGRYPRENYGMQPYNNGFRRPTYPYQPRYSYNVRQYPTYRRGRGGFRRIRRPYDPNAPTSSTQIHISNLPYTLTKEQLADAFKEFKIKEVVLAHRTFDTTRNNGYGFIEFQSPQELEKVLAKYQTIQILNRTCQVHRALDLAHKQEARAAAATARQ